LPASPAGATILLACSRIHRHCQSFNEENGFGVLKVKANGHRDLVTVVGSLPSVSAGEWLTAQGRWVQDRELGLQFRAETLQHAADPRRKASRSIWAAEW
jgi:hypothetical protein